MPEYESNGIYKWESAYIRYYIPWISQSSGKQATFYPSKKIQIGDYGVIDKTNEFERRGNIFNDGEILGIIPELATDDLWKPQTTSEEDKLVLTLDTQMTDLGPNEDAELRLQFTGGGKFFVMYRPKSVDIPGPVDLAKLSKIQKLNGMRLVTGTVTCPAYAFFFFSYTYTRTVYICLTRSSPDTSANSPAKQGWIWDTHVVHKDGYNSEGDHEYTPLFSLTETITYKPSDGKDASNQTVPVVDPIKPRLPIPPPSAGDGNEIFKSGEIGVPPWISGKSKRPEKWKNRPAAPSDPEAHRESIHMDNLDASEPPSTTTIGPNARSNQAVGAADQTRVYYSRMPESDSSGCLTSCCCFQ